MTRYNTLLKYWFGIGLALLMIAVQASPVAIQELLIYDRPLIFEGQLWRIITAHLCHLGWSHLLMNLLGLIMVMLFFGNYLSHWIWLLILFIGMIGTSLLLLIFNPELVWYVGLSGVLHTLFIAGGIADIQHRPKEAYIFLLLIIAKLYWEQRYGPLPGSEATAGGNVIVDAHFYGAIFGLSIIPISYFRKK